jgi:hypothetical protein
MEVPHLEQDQIEADQEMRKCPMHQEAWRWAPNLKE